MRAFWPVASISVFVAIIFTASALWVVLNPASGCTVDGQACISVGFGWLALSIGVPPAVLLTVVAIGLRIRRHSPRAAVALVALPPILIAGVAAAKVMGFAGY